MRAGGASSFPWISPGSTSEEFNNDDDDDDDEKHGIVVDEKLPYLCSVQMSSLGSTACPFRCVGGSGRLSGLLSDEVCAFVRLSYLSHGRRAPNNVLSPRLEATRTVHLRVIEDSRMETTDGTTNSGGLVD